MTEAHPANALRRVMGSIRLADMSAATAALDEFGSPGRLTWFRRTDARGDGGLRQVAHPRLRVIIAERRRRPPAGHAGRADPATGDRGAGAVAAPGRPDLCCRSSRCPAGTGGHRRDRQRPQRGLWLRASSPPVTPNSPPGCSPSRTTPDQAHAKGATVETQPQLTRHTGTRP